MKMKVRNEKFFIKKRVEYNNKNKENNSTIETKYDKHGNKFSIYETVK